VTIRLKEGAPSPRPPKGKLGPRRSKPTAVVGDFASLWWPQLAEIIQQHVITHAGPKPDLNVPTRSRLTTLSHVLSAMRRAFGKDPRSAAEVRAIEQCYDAAEILGTYLPILLGPRSSLRPNLLLTDDLAASANARLQNLEMLLGAAASAKTALAYERPLPPNTRWQLVAFICGQAFRAAMNDANPNRPIGLTGGMVAKFLVEVLPFITGDELTFGTVNNALKFEAKRYSRAGSTVPVRARGENSRISGRNIRE
jgi:hypothetical protein